MRWDAARLASERPLPKPRKMHGPVGSEMLNGVDEMANRPACRKCGYLCCALIPGKCVPYGAQPFSEQVIRGAEPVSYADCVRTAHAHSFYPPKAFADLEICHCQGKDIPHRSDNCFVAVHQRDEPGPASGPVDATGSPVAPDDPELHARVHRDFLEMWQERLTSGSRLSGAPQVYCSCGAAHLKDECPHR